MSVKTDILGGALVLKYVAELGVGVGEVVGEVHIHTKVRGCNRLVHVTVISSSISLPLATFKLGFTAGD